MTRAFKTPPAIEAPPSVTGLAIALIAAHALRVFSPAGWQGFILSAGSLQPDRFWAWAGFGAPDSVPYGSPVGAFLPFLTEALLHDGWGAVILNAALVVILGRPVYFSLSIGRRRPAWAFLAVFAASVAGGSLLHLLTQYPAGSALIGASGGASGLFAGWVLIQEGRNGRILSARFLTVFLVFAAINLALWLLGPALLGARISWQAHIGGFLVGAAAFQVLRFRGRLTRI